MSDYHKRYAFLRELFPTQFRSIPSIIIWTLVYIFDVAVVFFAAYLLGFPILDAAGSKLIMGIYLVIAFGLFCLESFLYNLIKH